MRISNKGKKQHGHCSKNYQSPTYQSWRSMIQRCMRNDKYYEEIEVCARWRHFENFLKDMGERPEGKSIDRIDNNKGYSKSNCRWSTASKQMQNRRISRQLTHNGQTMFISEWAEKLKINEATLRIRLWRNWSIERALS